MYIETVRNRNSPPAILLREGWREGKKVRKRTLANLSHLPKNIIELIRRALKGEAFVAVSEAFEVIKSSLHGHVNACRTTMRRLRFDKLLASKPCRERNLVEAMVAARILEPDSKLATTRWWHTTTLPESLGVADANEDDLYAAMDWLLERQERIEKKLAGRHLKKGGLVLYDLSSSYFEGVTCPLAAMGYSRDGKRDRLQVNYGLVTDERGCPVAVSVFAGNESDSTTLMPQVEMVRNRFGIKTLVLVGDRGMISQKRIDDDLRNLEGVDWITALKSASIRKLIDGGQLQLGLFDERNLFELTHPDFAGERLFACRNTELAKLRVHKRQSLLQATARELARIQTMVQRARLRGKDKISARVRKVVTKTLAKYFVLDIRDDDFTFQIPNKEVAAKAALDSIYKRLTKLRSNVELGNLKGKDKIRARVHKLITKKIAKHFDLDIRDDEFRFRIVELRCPWKCYVSSRYRPFRRISSVAGVDAPAFVERSGTATSGCGPAWCLMPRPSLSAEMGAERGAGIRVVSPGLMPRPSLSAYTAYEQRCTGELVSPGLMPRPSLSAGGRRRLLARVAVGCRRG